MGVINYLKLFTWNKVGVRYQWGLVGCVFFSLCVLSSCKGKICPVEWTAFKGTDFLFTWREFLLDSFQIVFCCLQVALLAVFRSQRFESCRPEPEFSLLFLLVLTLQKGFSFPEGHSVFIVAATFQWSGQELGRKVYVVCWLSDVRKDLLL